MARISIRWFRRDLRLTDNTALHQAAKTSAQVVPVYILSTWKRFDPDGACIKQWVPELKEVPAEKFLQAPDTALAKGYPMPNVDHSKERERTLSRFKEAMGKWAN